MALAGIQGVVCCGNVVFDIAVWPVVDLNWNTTTWVESISEGIGGNGANTSTTLAKLGVPVGLLSVVGDDEIGARLLEILRTNGVDIGSVSTVPGERTPCTTVLVHRGGDRKFLHRPGASRNMVLSQVDLAPRAGFSHFHLANPFALPSLRSETGDLMRRAKEAGYTTSIDTGWDSKERWMLDLSPALPYTDLLFANDAEARLLGGSTDVNAAVAQIQKNGVPDIVVKTGPSGCTLYCNGVSDEVAGFQVSAVDTTGAGDCFAGAFLAGIAQGWSYRKSAEFANAVGAMNVEHIGAINGVLSLEKTQQWMHSHRSPPA
ncbi:MAG: carbohydrate kinase family protein [Bryobacteraceae bacterium]|nr:carbohydrate kinase family protein [Bryobacteraceae bacterium]